jgi:transposase-like protein
MTCAKCHCQAVKRFGFNRNRSRRYRCTNCLATFSEPAEAPFLAGHTTDRGKALHALELMLEGMSVCAVSRLTGLHKRTILSLVDTAAQNAERVFDGLVPRARPRSIYLDKIPCTVGCHERRLTAASPAGWGDHWTWLAFDPESKLILSYFVGPRRTASANSPLRGGSGGFAVYPLTSRSNLSARLHIQRLVWKSNALSKKLANLRAAVALLVAWYNFCHIHQKLRVTPAMEAGVTDHVWTLAELVRTRMVKTLENETMPAEPVQTVRPNQPRH